MPELLPMGRISSLPPWFGRHSLSSFGGEGRGEEASSWNLAGSRRVAAYEPLSLAPSPRKRGEGKLRGHGGSSKIRPASLQLPGACRADVRLATVCAWAMHLVKWSFSLLMTTPAMRD